MDKNVKKPLPMPPSQTPRKTTDSYERRDNADKSDVKQIGVVKSVHESMERNKK